MKLFNSSIGKKLGAIALAVAAAGFGSSQVRADDYATPAADVAYQPRSMDDLQQLTAPIALYPDALLAQVLVASTYPNDVVAASQSVAAGTDPSQFAAYGWDASVQGLAQTPDVLSQLAGNVDWMNQLGDAFLNQQQDVFSAVQALRSQALNAGTLVSNAQEQVIVSNGMIQIVPANPQVIYVPHYDPAVVYVAPTGVLAGPCITFDVGHPVGLWLHDDFDWFDHRVYFGSWGADRPWWNHDGGHDGDYVRNRPGTYITNVRNVSNIRNQTNISSRSSVWVHNNGRPGPERLAGPVRNRTTEPMRQPGKTLVHGPMQPNRGNFGGSVNRNVRPAPTRSTTVTTSHTTTVQPNRPTLTNHVTAPTRTTTSTKSRTTTVQPNRPAMNSGHSTTPSRPASAGRSVSKKR